MYSITLRLFFRLIKILSKERRRSLYQIIPLAIITGICDVLVVGLVSRLFVILVGRENRPSIPFSDLLSTDPFTKLVILISIYVGLNWVASFLKLYLRSFQERLRALIFIIFTVFTKLQFTPHGSRFFHTSFIYLFHIRL